MVPGGLLVTSSTTRLTSAHLVGDPGRDPLQHVVGHPGPVGGHGVLAGHRPQHDRVPVGAAVALHAHRPDVGQQHHRALPDLLVQARGRQFLAGDRVGAPQRVQPVRGDFADDPDAKPGPGKGWRATISSGRPSSRPTARTSSLNSSRSGSTSLNFRSSGRPPTLWWLLMFAAPVPPPDSTTSGYSVPCTRKSISSSPPPAASRGPRPRTRG